MRGSVYLLLNREGIQNEVLEGRDNFELNNDLRNKSTSNVHSKLQKKDNKKIIYSDSENSNNEKLDSASDSSPSGRNSLESARDKTAFWKKISAPIRERRDSLPTRGSSFRLKPTLTRSDSQKNFQNSLAVEIPKNRITLPVSSKKIGSPKESPRSVAGSPRSAAESPRTSREFVQENPGFTERLDKLEKQRQPLTRAKIQKQYPDMKIQKRLSKNSAFGEIALLSHAARTGTIVCREETHLMTLDRRAYEKLFGEYHQQKYLEKVEFIQKIDLFHDWSRKNISALLYMFEEKQYSRGAILYKEKDPCNTFFCIKEGEIEVTFIA